MITWLNVFEKYRVDLRVLEIYRDELATLAEHSHRRTVLTEAIRQVEQHLHAAERLLAHYGDGILSPRLALQYADERLFLAYRYLYGLTMEATALEMGISRDTVYRIRRRVVARGAVPETVLQRFGILDLSAAIGRAAPDEGYDEGSDERADLQSDDIPSVPCEGSDALCATASATLRAPLPYPAITADSDDVDDVLAACFAGSYHGVPAALIARRSS